MNTISDTSKTVELAFVVCKSVDMADAPSYWLQGNVHLLGPNFLGGHVDPGESPRDAAIRELIEELGDAELGAKWGLSTDSAPGFSVDRLALIKFIKPLHGDDPICLPFYSRRASMERVGLCHFYELDLSSTPEGNAIEERLHWLAGRTHPDDPSLFASQRLTGAELLAEAWRNPVNPFIRAYVKHINRSMTNVPVFKLDLADLESQLEARLRTAMPLENSCISATLVLPKTADIQDAFAYGDSLTMGLELRWSGSDDVFRARMPFAHEGVFVLGEAARDAGHSVAYSRWHPALVAQPGYWAVREFHAGGETARVLKVALENGRVINMRLDEVRKGAIKTRSDQFRYATPVRQGNLPRSLMASLPGPGELVSESSLRERLEEALKVLATNEGIDWLDDQNLRYQRLYTYSAHILAVFGWFLRQIGGSKRDRESFWRAMLSGADAFADQAFPLKHLRKTGRLHSFRPINALDAISRLTSFTKYPYRSEILERLPAVFRQIHPSYRGVVCPFESPESKLVGLTLNLARGVNVDAQGVFKPAVSNDTSLQVGYSASLVPFLCHNDAPRTMMGAKNMKQAVRIRDPRPPMIDTHGDAAIFRLVRPLQELGVLSADVPAAPGRDLLVAYMPYDGLNFEDGIVANQRLRDEESMNWIEDEHIEYFIEPDWELCPGSFGEDSWERSQAAMFDHRGLRRLGSLIQSWPDGDRVAHVQHRYSKNLSHIKLFLASEAELIGLEFLPAPAQGYCSALHLTLRRYRPLAVGDKLMGRHGNKGVIATFIDPERMPRYPADSRLPDSIRGRSVDLLLNPNGVISRMNMGQLIETQATLAMTLGGPKFEGQQQFDALSRQALAGFFEANTHGFDRYGGIRLELPDRGVSTTLPVTTGFQYFLRLKQSPMDKAQVRAVPRSVAGYSRLTGQPLGGRRRGGGQRLGEMEVWALAAHGAGRFLSSALTVKSDYSRLQGNNDEPSTYRSIQDFLKARGLEMATEAGAAVVGVVHAEENAQRLLTSSGLAQVVVRIHARCETCTKTIETEATPKQRDGLKVDLAGWFSRHGLVLTDQTMATLNAELGSLSPPFDWKTTFVVSEHGVGLLIGALHVRMVGKMAYQGDVEVAGKAQTFKGRLDATRITVSKLITSLLTCPEHPEVLLSVDTGEAYTLTQPLPGGLFDSALFGDDGRQFAGLRYPVSIDADHTLVWQVLPVLPARYRSVSNDLGGRSNECDSLTKIYQQMFDTARDVDKLLSNLTQSSSIDKKAALEQVNQKLRQIANNKAELYNQLDNRIKGKFGLLRRFGLGRRVNLSGRFVIVPGPKLAWDQCGLPVGALAMLLADKIALWDALGDLKGIKVEVLDSQFWLKLGERRKLIDVSGEFIASIVHVLAAFLAEHPSIRVVLNRAPSLHKYSVMALRPLLLPVEDGFVLRINPLVCAGFGADFDGDEMSVHMPLTEAEHLEAAQLMSPVAERNLLSVATGKPLAGFSQDMVLGCYLASLSEFDRARFIDIFPDPCCQKILRDYPCWTKAVSQELLGHLCKAHADQAPELISRWVSACFAKASESGSSFGYLDLLSISTPVPAGEDAPGNGELSRRVGRIVESIYPLTEGDPPAGAGFAALANSGARGGPEQTRQMLVMRGMLDPGAIGFTSQDRTCDFTLRTNLLLGMTSDDAFQGAFNGRSSMIDKKLGTPVAGALTRRLVLAAWTWLVEKGHCGVDVPAGSVLACHWLERKRICTHCYGTVFGVSDLSGYACGLIAAQSFGERGTQLSMQSFHTGEKAISLAVLEQWMSRMGEHHRYESFKEGIARFGVYDALDERHLKLIWLAMRGDCTDLDMALFGRGQTFIETATHAQEDRRQLISTSPFLRLLFNQAPVWTDLGTGEPS
ncbi:NUDIX domain-containing protein [Candidatus Symbiobacter mobilis]|uniref:Bifunctional DNA-directed RNA polymerase subunit beta-beta' n=1 Tax=Candidatus Symbiobacter mobilis CR TaxID=946483 RepID=U5NBP4_9BURK|nr:NUDIX domain-containing protein [Candidatus Symbiobacter mobilis]AGX88740.1 DNA-directed RNA polymerase I subunit A1 [Candidatus Symbiobacter mobilis CR]